MSEEVIEKLIRILNITFPNFYLPDDIVDLTIGSCEEWDSLGNYALLMMVEQEFKLTFTMKELTEIRSIEQIIVRLKNN